MRANDGSFLRLLDGTKQFTLPIFQRRYSWGKTQCEQLWNDVLRVGESENIQSHFLGSIVSIGDGSPTVPEFRVIDGQQRLTTLSLLLSAIGRAIEMKQFDIPIDRSRLEGYFLFNEREDGARRYKQRLTKHDDRTYKQLLDDGQATDNTSLLVENYRFFENKLNHADLKVVYDGIQKLVIVDIALDSGSDNPQLIFESLNSTGLSLSQADLIRNYMLMGQESKFQDRLYETYWFPMEQSFGEEYIRRFDLFIRDYLTLKTRLIPNKTKVYESFKRYVDEKRQPEALETVIKEIVRYSEHYVCIVLLEEPDQTLCGCFEDIRTLGVEVVYPFLLGVYEDYKQGQLGKGEVIKILGLVESYLFRRAICDLQTQGLNRTFAGLIGRIDKEDYLHSLKIILSASIGTQRFPSDNDFRREFLTKDVYNLRVRNYLLRKLENHDRKEPIRVDDYTIEHVMPQTLTDEWREELGENWNEVHEKYLHTVGNLTLTGYNSEFSNSTFIEKQCMEGGFLDSPLRLNTSLRELERWNESAIVKRAEILTEKACEIWPHHGCSQEHQQGQKGRWTLANHPYFANEWRRLFVPLRQRLLDLGNSVSEKINRYYIAYKKNGTSFANFFGCKTWFRLILRAQKSDIDDPREMCVKRTRKTSWGLWLGVAAADDSTKYYSLYHYQLGAVDDLNYISVEDDLDYIMYLVRQVFEKVD